jgi:N-acetylneuraminic acid mutarotase
VSDNYLNSNVATAAYNIGSSPSAEWTWMGGSSVIGEPGWYGVLGASAAANTPGGRDWAGSWTDSGGNLWLFGGNGFDESDTPGFMNDLWKFNPSTSEWTWMAGSSAVSGNCLSEGSITFCGEPGWYGTLGVPAAGNIPGGREWATSWTDHNGHFWLFGGWGFDASGTLGFLNDLWEFDPATNQWTWIAGSNTTPCLYCGRAGVYGMLGTSAAANMPGSRYQTASWVDGNGHLWMFGGVGYDYRGINCYLNDLWEFDPSSGQWTWRSGSDIGGGVELGLPGVYGTMGTPAPSNVPGGRQDPMSWMDGNGHFWLFGGYAFDINDDPGLINDLWEFNPSSDEWTWMAGSSTAGSTGVYGTLGIPAAGNSPGARTSGSTWTDKAGNLWLYAGSGANATVAAGALDDLWEFNPSIREWAWVGGSSTSFDQLGVYGVLGASSAGSTPGARGFATMWTDSNGNFWLFGGAGDDAKGAYGFLNDLWEYGASAPPAVPPSPAAAPVFSLAGGSYSTARTLTLSDPTPNASIYYTTDGTTPVSSSTVYTGPITVSSSETVEAIAVSSGYSVSTLATASYIINLPQATSPSFSLPAGTYTSAQSVTITDATSGATIYYTTNGTTPTTGSAVYSGAIAVSSSETLEAIAMVSGYSTSATATAVYTLMPPPTISLTNGSSVSVSIPSPGQNSAATITVTPSGGFTGSVALSASVTNSPTGAQDLPALSFGSTSPVIITGASAGAATLTISTTAATTGALEFPPVPEIRWTSGAGATLACLLLCGIPVRWSRVRTLLGLLVFFAILAGGIAGCGGKSGNTNQSTGNPGTTTGNYTVTVTATSGATNAQTTVSVTVN